jgi:hypothetical protein
MRHPGLQGSRQAVVGQQGLKLQDCRTAVVSLWFCYDDAMLAANL